MTNVAVCIPARLHSTRVPRKLLREVNGKPIILHAYDRCKEFYKNRADVFVITDSHEIGSLIKEGVVYEKSYCENGTERIAKAVTNHFGMFRDYHYFINIQGDNTKLDDKCLEDIYNAPFHLGEMFCYTLGTPLTEDRKNTKMVLGNFFDEEGNRRIIFAHRNILGCPEEYDHVGVYGYTHKALKDYLEFKHKPVQRHYDYELLSFIENGMLCVSKIDNYDTKSVNFTKDLEK